MTLLEVILSLAILGGMIAVIGELARNAFKNARTARDQVQAELLAESILAKIRLGIIEMEEVFDFPIGSVYSTINPADIVLDTHAVAEGFGEEPWSYSVEVFYLDEYLSLVEIAVTVRQNEPDNPRAVACRLVRWLALEPEIEEEESEPPS